MDRSKSKSVQRLIRVPVEDYDAMRETIDVLRDRELSKSIARGFEDVREGRTVPHPEVQKALQSR